MQGDSQKVGNHKKSHPYPMRLRSPYIPREYGGSEGWRGKNWAKVRKEVVARDGNRSTTTGFDKAQGKGLQVDHIIPWRLGGKNNKNNLRTTDFLTNHATDNSTGSEERKIKRDPRW